MIAEHYRQKAGFTEIIDYVKGFSTDVYAELQGKIHQQIDLLYIDGDHSVTGAYADFNTYYNDVRCGGLIVLHDIYPTMCGVDGPRVLLDHLKAYGLLSSHLQLLELPTCDGFGIAVLKKVSMDLLQIPLPEGDRKKRWMQKLQGQQPLFSRIPFIPEQTKCSISIRVIDAKTQQPIPNARIAIPQRYDEEHRTNPEGELWISYLVPYRYLVNVEAQGYQPVIGYLLDVTATEDVQQFLIELEL